MVEDFKHSLLEKLSTLQSEVKSYKNDEAFQAIPPGVSNSAEVLCKHILGNLNWFLGAQLGSTGYERNRDAEFSPSVYSKETIIDSIEQTKDMVADVLEDLWNEDLTKPYPILFKNQEVSVHYMLLTITSHTDYHLGQINYARRITS